MEDRVVSAAAGRAWAEELPDQLHKQKAKLAALIDAVDADARWEALELGCSVAAGRADELSDLDVGLFYGSSGRPDDDAVDRMVRGLGDVIEVSAQPWEGMPRWWVQYADGAQLDLVVLAADSRPGCAPGAVMLLDRMGLFAHQFTSSLLRTDPLTQRQWVLDGWEALSNVAKYLQRGSFLEAIQQLHRARERVFQIWSANQEVDYPVFGLTSLLDDAGTLPPDIESTYPTIDRQEVVRAAEVLAGLLDRGGRAAVPPVDTPLGAFVLTRLASLSR